MWQRSCRERATAARSGAGNACSCVTLQRDLHGSHHSRRARRPPPHQGRGGGWGRLGARFTLRQGGGSSPDSAGAPCVPWLGTRFPGSALHPPNVRWQRGSGCPWHSSAPEPGTAGAGASASWEKTGARLPGTPGDAGWGSGRAARRSGEGDEGRLSLSIPAERIPAERIPASRTASAPAAGACARRGRPPWRWGARTTSLPPAPSCQLLVAKQLSLFL